MKDFFKFTLATVTGIILSSIVLFFIGIMVIFGIVSSSDTETVVKKNSVMMLDLNGILVERTQESLENVLSMLTGDNSNVYGLDDILASIKKAKENENIKGIYIQASALGSPYASLQAIIQQRKYQEHTKMVFTKELEQDSEERSLSVFVSRRARS